MGTALSQFADYMATTGPVFLTGPEQIINEVQKRTTTLGELLRGKGMDRVIQGGSTIEDTVLAVDPGTFQTYKPRDVLTWEHKTVTKEHEVDWRFALDYIAWTLQEVTLQPGMTRKARAQTYKRLQSIKEKAMWTSTLNGFENLLWQEPWGNFDAMEGASGQEWLSLPVFINEEDGAGESPGVDEPADGLYDNGVDGTLEWTSIQGTDPRSETWFRNKRKQYDAADLDDADGSRNGLIDAFDKMVDDLEWEEPPLHPEAFEGPLTFGNQHIWTQAIGKQIFRKLLRDGNDAFYGSGGRNDPYYTPMYHGRRVLQKQQLENALLYPGAANAYVKRADATSNGPRFYFTDGEYLTPIFHESNYFSPDEAEKHPNEVDTWRKLFRTWGNLFCNSRQHHGIVYPTGTLAT